MKDEAHFTGCYYYLLLPVILRRGDAVRRSEKFVALIVPRQRKLSDAVAVEIDQEDVDVKGDNIVPNYDRHANEHINSWLDKLASPAAIQIATLAASIFFYDWIHYDYPSRNKF